MSDDCERVDVYLVNNLPGLKTAGFIPSLGLEFIKDYLLAHGVNCDIKYPGSIVKGVNPLVVGIGGYPRDVFLIKRAARDIKSDFPNVKIVVGGTVSVFHDELLRTPSIDAVCFGDGENALLEYVNRLKNNESLSGCPGFYQRDGYVPSIPACLDDLITPDFAGIDLDGSAPLSTSRGCNGNCSFCESKFYNHGLRVMSAPKVIEWINELRARHSLSEVCFLDDNFLAIPSRAEAILDYLSTVGLRADIISRADSLVKSESIVRNYSRVINRVSVGIESFSQSQLDRWNKCLTVEVNNQALDLMHQARLYSDCFIIISDGRTTLREVSEQVEGMKNAPGTFYKSGEIPFVLRNFELGTVSHTRYRYGRHAFFETDAVPYLKVPQRFLDKSTYNSMKFLSTVLIQGAYDNPKVISDGALIARMRLDIYLEGVKALSEGGDASVFRRDCKDFTSKLDSIVKKICLKDSVAKQFYDSLTS